MPSVSTRESRIRRRLARGGERLWKPRGRYEWQYGPYAIVDIATNGIGSSGHTLEQLESFAATGDL